ncbi:GH13223 [Drosophila grimshawi]|uniref:GH13223 n=1 Tax=Drosophila grimshawi TaxID=7222 RepID=B4JTZ9_DROGR|nr:GH13223 [Drosophila grimshawi]
MPRTRRRHHSRDRSSAGTRDKRRRLDTGDLSPPLAEAPSPPRITKTHQTRSAAKRRRHEIDANTSHISKEPTHQQQQTRRRSEHLGSTTCEYNFDDSLSSSRRRKERSKRSHRKSPATGRRQHKYRYRDEASHSSSRRRHRDRPKDERDSGRNNRQSQAKVKTFHFLNIPQSK